MKMGDVDYIENLLCIDAEFYSNKGWTGSKL